MGTCATEDWARQKKTNAVVTAVRTPVLPKNDFMPRNIIGLFECLRKDRCGGVVDRRPKVPGRTGEDARLSILEDACVAIPCCGGRRLCRSWLRRWRSRE